MKKKWSVLALSMALAALAACGTADQPTPSPDSSSPPPSETQEETVSPSPSESPDALVFGTATLSYAEFYAGDVSATESFDAVTSATTSKYEIMPNMATDFVDEATNADGYHITGVKNVNVAVPAGDVEAYQAANGTFSPIEGEAPAQYKTVSMDSGAPVYSATQFNIADTVTDATAELITGSNWGDYQINVTDGAVVHLRNAREDEGFDIGADIQGVILETDDGLKVGMEHLQSIWVQPYEVSFNVPDDNTHNTHISGFDNLPELGKLVGKTVTKITYIMPDAAYEYQFDGIYIKPIYTQAISAEEAEGYDALTLSISEFGEFTNGKLTVTYTLGSGRNREVTTLLETPLVEGTADYSWDASAVAELDQGGTYAAVISSDSYADVQVALPVSDGQRAALEALMRTANEKLATQPDNAVLQAHIEEAEKLLADAAATSKQAGSLIGELTSLTAEEEGKGSGH